MCVCLPVCLSVCLSACLPAGLAGWLAVCLCVFVCAVVICLSLCLFVFCLFVFVHLLGFACLCLLVVLYVCFGLFFFLCVCVFIFVLFRLLCVSTRESSLVRPSIMLRNLARSMGNSLAVSCAITKQQAAIVCSEPASDPVMHESHSIVRGVRFYGHDIRFQHAGRCCRAPGF